ncbi:WbqC family protein [Bacteroidota bacterium]
MTKKVAILQSNYIPWKGYFDLINQVDAFVVYDEVQYTKNDWRNRNIIKTKNGPLWLTIPVKQLNLNQKIHETKVFQKNWNVKHWKTIKTYYGRSPFFKEYEEVFYETYMNIQTEYLSEINLIFISLVNKILGIDTEIIDSRTLQLNGDKNERLIEAVKKVGGTSYLSGPAAQGYLQVDLFKQEGITVDWMDYSHYPEYQQQHPPFTHRVSIIDLIFQIGGNNFKDLRA